MNQQNTISYTTAICHGDVGHNGPNASHPTPPSVNSRPATVRI